jgi:hypothetical protein
MYNVPEFSLFHLEVAGKKNYLRRDIIMKTETPRKRAVMGHMNRRSVTASVANC